MSCRGLTLLALGLLVACAGDTGPGSASGPAGNGADVPVLGNGTSDAVATSDGVSQQDAALPPVDAASRRADVATGVDTSSQQDATVAPCGDGACASDEDCESCPLDCPVCPLEAGVMVITEIMKDPDAVMDSQGEWIELTNVSDQAIDLKGMVLRDLGSDTHVIDPDGSLEVAPGEYVVLSVSADLGVGLSADYVLSGFYLDNSADEVILEQGDVILDVVAYDTDAFPDPVGASLKLHGGDDPSAEANDDGGSWCASTTAFGAGDLGTPGEPNPPCDVCGDGVCGVAEACDMCVEDCGACTPCDQGGAPLAEYCNGIDDDCDDEIDEDTCADNLPCTADFCLPGQGCAHEVVPASDGQLGCAIDGDCWPDGWTNPNNPCQNCDVEETQVFWTNKNFGTCMDDDPCMTSGVCVLGQCDGTPIVDTYEHNDSKTLATQLGGIGDGADWPAGQIGATLFGPGDEDWFQYTVSDDWLSSFAPRADLTVVPALSSYELCLYMVCDGGKELELKGCTAGEESTGDAGMKGCCSTESAQLDVNCDGSSESGTLFVQITRTSGPWTCEPYAFQWGDD